jgi:hypothetical protein
MPRTYSLDDPQFSIPTVIECKAHWENIPYKGIKHTIALEEQLVCFLRYLLKNLRHRHPQKPNMAPMSLDFALRACFLKLILVQYSSIIEASLFSIAQKRGYKLPQKIKLRTFGKILESWENAGKREIGVVWTELTMFKKYRNSIHLYTEIPDSKEGITSLISKEQSLLDKIDSVIDVLRSIEV